MDLKNKISDWINKNGYPFELRVAKSFSKAGFTVSQSIYFEDPITKKFRETDIIAHSTKEVNNVWVNLTFVIECKTSKDKPWVSFHKDEAINFTGTNLPIMTSKNGRILLSEISKNTNFQSDLIFPNTQKMGYSIVRALNSGKDLAYTATQSVMSAVEYLVEKSNSSNKKFINIYFPIIVIEGDLFEARISENDDINLKEVNETKISTIKSFAEQNSTFLTIINSKNLEDFPIKLKSECQNFYSRYSKEIDKITKENPDNSSFFVF